MPLKYGGKITMNTQYSAEFHRAEEVAELGDHAEFKRMRLPSHFDIANEKLMEMFYTSANKIMNEENYDAVVVEKETYEEFVYYK